MVAIEALKGFEGKHVVLRGWLSGCRTARAGLLRRVWQEGDRIFVQLEGVGIYWIDRLESLEARSD